jgi:hypothetical protein
MEGTVHTEMDPCIEDVEAAKMAGSCGTGGAVLFEEQQTPGDLP